MREADEERPARTDAANPLPEEGRRRIVLESLTPRIDGGRFPIKRTVGETVDVEVDAFTDGHDVVVCDLLHGPARHTDRLQRREMEPLGNDRWHGAFPVEAREPHVYTVEAWIDRFRSWRREFEKRVLADQDVAAELVVGARLVSEAARRATRAAAAEDAARLGEWARELARPSDPEASSALALGAALLEAMARHPDRSLARRHPELLRVEVDRPRARFSAWYEFFPRSCTDDPSRHGTLGDCESRLEHVAAMGFDVLYLPPIHPIGRTHRKGRNNTGEAGPDDVGSPWAIGSDEGGHKAVHPRLGTLVDFRRLLAKAEAVGLEVALDIALQCSPDHPYVKEHPEWFQKRPDGSIRYAENPPKKYEDIYPFDFETDAWPALWRELRSIFDFWIDQGVRIFRVDNPHTKPFAFWEWCLGGIRRDHPDVLFLSEAFTRPKVMYRLAKIGFTQSYTYFTWRNTRYGLERYFHELTQTDVAEFFRPNLWPNTPDILSEVLQTGGRPAFQLRAVLAATLGANWGIYGPAFELGENAPREVGGEEYLDSEKYQIRARSPSADAGLAPLLGRLNRIRRENPALQQDRTLRFHGTDNDQMVCYSKRSADGTNTILVVANLDPHHVQSGWIDLDLAALGLHGDTRFQVHDLVGDGRYLWQGARNFVRLDPAALPAQVFRLRHRARTERDFDYFM